MSSPARKALAIGTAASALLPQASWARTIGVPGEFASIQAAIDAAEPSDTVLVEPGSYRENLTLRTGVAVIGLETARTLIRPDDDTLPIVTISGVSGVRFSRFTLLDAANGVTVTLSVSVDVTNVVFEGLTETALTADAASSVEVLNNVFFRNEKAVVRGGGSIEVTNAIFFANVSSVETLLSLADPFVNVQNNCFFRNQDVADGDSDTGVGAGAVFGDPLFVDPGLHDFHLREGSPCIDIGRGTDVIDRTPADAGAYGGTDADPFPFPVAAPTVTASTSDAGPSITVEWLPNLSYLVTNTTHPGSYRVYYKQGVAPEPDLPSDYDGTDAGGGTQPSPVEAGNTTSATLANLRPEVQATPPAPRLLDAAARDQGVVLTWEAVPQATAYRVHFGQQNTSEQSADAGAETTFTVTGLVNDTEYVFAVTAVNQTPYTVAVTALDNTQDRHESALSPPVTVGVGDAAESAPSNSLTATPALVTPYPDLTDQSRCFIATAAFDSPSAPEVLALRRFRDVVLSRHAVGRRLIAAYYAVSPPIARFLEAHAYMKPPVRAVLRPLALAAAGAAARRAARSPSPADPPRFEPPTREPYATNGQLLGNGASGDAPTRPQRERSFESSERNAESEAARNEPSAEQKRGSDHHENGDGRADVPVGRVRIHGPGRAGPRGL